MNTATIVFYALLGAYLLGLGIFALVKRIRNRKRVQSEMEDIKHDDVK